MRLLLDTHIFLWFILGEERIKPSVRASIENADVAYLSVISLWETTIKFNLGKLALPEPPLPWLAVQREEHGIESLPLNETAIQRLATLPLHHRDPFDRILVCQALEHDLQIITVDPAFAKYTARVFAPA